MEFNKNKKLSSWKLEVIKNRIADFYAAEYCPFCDFEEEPTFYIDGPSSTFYCTNDGCHFNKELWKPECDLFYFNRNYVDEPDAM